MGGGSVDAGASEESSQPVPPADALADALGLDGRGAEVLRSASRHIVRFPTSQVLAVASAPDGIGPHREVMMAKLLDDAGAPTTRCLAGPMTVDGWTVTAWREVTAVEPDRRADATVLGELATAIHRSTAALDPRQAIPCDPVGGATQHITAAAKVGATPRAELDLLRRLAADLEPWWHAAVAATGLKVGAPEDPTSGAVIHGDLHAANVVIGPDGPIAIDLELAGWGPRGYDAAPTVALVRWYGWPDSALADFDRAYGTPLTAAAREGHLDEVWALWSTAWAVANRHRSAAAEEEAATRLATLATGSAPRPWRLS